MSKEARLKEEIGWLKIVFAVAAALDASLAAWLAQAYNDANRFVLVAGLIAALALAGVVVLANYRAYRRIAELENL